MNSFITLSVFFALFCAIYCAVYFREDFDTPAWQDRWIQSQYPDKEFGIFEWTAGNFFGDDLKDKGIKTSQDVRFYGISSKFEDNKFDNEGKTLVVQFSVKHEQNIDCGGGYLKLYDCSLDQKNLHGDSPYIIMFGPDICGPATKKVHAIFNYKGKNLLINKEVRCKDDVHTHVYRLVVKPDNTYKISIDGETVEKGELEKDWNFLPPRKILDPAAKKPEDWVDESHIDDPTDFKPDDWDQPQYIPDPEAKKPEDWDDEMDGEWEAPSINNPKYKGEWKARQVANPKYKGPWVHPEIDNPEYYSDDKLYRYNEICGVGFDLWQVKAGTIFDNVLIGDSEEEADEVQNEILKRVKLEKKMKEKQDEEKKASDEEKPDDDDLDKDEDDKDEDKDADADADADSKRDEL